MPTICIVPGNSSRQSGQLHNSLATPDRGLGNADERGGQPARAQHARRERAAVQPAGEFRGLVAQAAFQRLEVELVGAAGPCEALELGFDEALRSGLLSFARQAWSLTSLSSATGRRKRRQPAICAQGVSSWSAGIVRVRVLPATARVRIQRGPWPGSWSSQRQLGWPNSREDGTREPGRKSPRAASCWSRFWRRPRPHQLSDKNSATALAGKVISLPNENS